MLIQLGAAFNRIGTDGDGVADDIEMNIISGNIGNGVRIESTDSDSNIVAGNYIGTNANSSTTLGNTSHGVLISNWMGGPRWNQIGTDGSNDNFNKNERNIISGNDDAGVYIIGLGSDQNVVAGNFIGTDVTGKVGLGNAVDGVSIRGGAADNLIGTNGDGMADAAERNIISGNAAVGVRIADAGTDGNAVAGNAAAEARVAEETEADASYAAGKISSSCDGCSTR